MTVIDCGIGWYWPQHPMGLMHSLGRDVSGGTITPDNFLESTTDKTIKLADSAIRQYIMQAPRTGKIRKFQIIAKASANDTDIAVTVENEETGTVKSISSMLIDTNRTIYEAQLDADLPVTKGDTLIVKITNTNQFGTPDFIPDEWEGRWVSPDKSPSPEVGVPNVVVFPSRNPSIRFTYFDDTSDREFVVIPLMGATMMESYEDEFIVSSFNALGNLISHPFFRMDIKGIYVSHHYFQGGTPPAPKAILADEVGNVLRSFDIPTYQSVTSQIDWSTWRSVFLFDKNLPYVMKKKENLRVYVESTGGTNIYSTKLNMIDVDAQKGMTQGPYVKGAVRRAGGAWQDLATSRFLSGLVVGKIYTKDPVCP